ncbi:MAG: CAP domain-containing protein [Erythrobacter sp.]
MNVKFADMKIGDKLTIAASAALGLAAMGAIVSPAVQADERPENRFAAELLDAHNDERVRFGASRLRWSPKLAQEAQQWAVTLAGEGRMRHASNDERGGAGENLWMGTASRFPASYMVGAFIDEKQYFRAGTFPQISTTGNWRDVGHYTQVVWPGTQQLGCAVARNRKDDFLVCRYWPAGNTYGVDIRQQ